MYWNKLRNNLTKLSNSWIVTLDVLKCEPHNVTPLRKALNSNIRCIEILEEDQWPGIQSQLNSNIRCIEIEACAQLQSLAALLNSNIRCIEIMYDFISIKTACLLNSNIRCIEIILDARDFGLPQGWIVTLDVLKCYYKKQILKKMPGWIVTLDVLKF